MLRNENELSLSSIDSGDRLRFSPGILKNVSSKATELAHCAKGVYCHQRQILTGQIRPCLEHPPCPSCHSYSSIFPVCLLDHLFNRVGCRCLGNVCKNKSLSVHSRIYHPVFLFQIRSFALCSRLFLHLFINSLYLSLHSSSFFAYFGLFCFSSLALCLASLFA